MSSKNPSKKDFEKIYKKLQEQEEENYKLASLLKNKDQVINEKTRLLNEKTKLLDEKTKLIRTVLEPKFDKPPVVNIDDDFDDQQFKFEDLLNPVKLADYKFAVDPANADFLKDDDFPKDIDKKSKIDSFRIEEQIGSVFIQKYKPRPNDPNFTPPVQEGEINRSKAVYKPQFDVEKQKPTCKGCKIRWFRGKRYDYKTKGDLKSKKMLNINDFALKILFEKSNFRVVFYPGGKILIDIREDFDKTFDKIKKYFTDIDPRDTMRKPYNSELITGGYILSKNKPKYQIKLMKYSLDDKKFVNENGELIIIEGQNYDDALGEYYEDDVGIKILDRTKIFSEIQLECAKKYKKYPFHFADFFNKEEEEEYIRVRKLLAEKNEATGQHTKRFINKTRQTIIQNSPRTFDEHILKPARDYFEVVEIPTLIDADDVMHYSKILRPKSTSLNFFNIYILAFLQNMHDKVYSTVGIINASIKLKMFTYNTLKFSLVRDSKLSLKKDTLYNATLKEIGEIRHSKKEEDFNIHTIPSNLRFKTKADDSNYHNLIIGYNITYETKQDKKLTVVDLNKLKAWKDNGNKKFNTYTCGSSRGSGLCIYETFLDIANIRTLKFRKDTPGNRKELKDKLKKEGKIIEDAVINGDLYRALQFLTKKEEYKDIEIVVITYGTLAYKDSTKNQFVLGFDENLPTKTVNGKTEFIKDISKLEDYHTKKIMLYQKDSHVAPSIFDFTILEQFDKKTGMKKVDEIKDNMKNQFVLKPNLIEKKKFEKRKEIDVLGFDFETKKNNTGWSDVFCGHVRGEISYGLGVDNYTDEFQYYDPESYKKRDAKDRRNVDKYFYGENTLEEFCKFVDKISQEDVSNKYGDRPTPVHIYGYNNSRFDNMFIWAELHNLLPGMDIIKSGSSIKYVKYRNVKIFDMTSYYRIGNLRTTAKAFKLEKEKGYYPYKFPDNHDLNYIGKVPKLKYWEGGKEEYDYCVAKHNGTEFNLKMYTIYYCRLDAELVYEMAKLHLDSCVGKIKVNGKDRYYDVRGCVTSASLSIKLLSQCFLEEDLWQSPDHIIKLEALAYKGGRTEVFKRYFDEITKRVYYFDINSSYPSSMTLDMPVKYLRSVKKKEPVVGDLDSLVPTNLYKATIIYKGKNKKFIPNILTRDVKSGSIIGCKESYEVYNWGCELIEAFKNGCSVLIHEIHKYEKKPIFKPLIEYLYQARLDCKNTNAALSLFFKTVMNSTYGKMGQRLFNKTYIFNTTNAMFKFIKGDHRILVNCEWCQDKLIAEVAEIDAEYKSIGKLVRFASYIAAQSRCKLSEIMRDIGHEHIYYCDTDSIFTDKEPSEKYISSSILGKWKMECSPIKRAYFIAPKFYFYEIEDNKAEIAVHNTFLAMECVGENGFDHAKYDKNKIESQDDICKKAKSITGHNISDDDYRDLCSGKLKNITQGNSLFVRSFEHGVKVIDKFERTVKPVLNKRIWKGNSSEAFKNIDYWREEKIVEKDVEKLHIVDTTEFEIRKEEVKEKINLDELQKIPANYLQWTEDQAKLKEKLKVEKELKEKVEKEMWEKWKNKEFFKDFGVWEIDSFVSDFYDKFEDQIEFLNIINNVYKKLYKIEDNINTPIDIMINKLNHPFFD